MSPDAKPNNAGAATIRDYIENCNTALQNTLVENDYEYICFDKNL